MDMQMLTDTSEGDYGMLVNRTLGWDAESGLGVLVVDHYCGEGRPEGGCLRPHLYTLSARQVTAARNAWSTRVEMADGYTEPAWEMWLRNHGDELMCRGRYYESPEAALRRHIRRKIKRSSVSTKV